MGNVLSLVSSVGGGMGASGSVLRCWLVSCVMQPRTSISS